tara:strand:- start:2519 stop:2710 length:192 start_codon:yes stop_codon:yes gene_type:complete
MRFGGDAVSGEQGLPSATPHPPTQARSVERSNASEQISAVSLCRDILVPRITPMMGATPGPFR